MPSQRGLRKSYGSGQGSYKAGSAASQSVNVQTQAQQEEATRRIQAEIQARQAEAARKQAEEQARRQQLRNVDYQRQQATGFRSPTGKATVKSQARYLTPQELKERSIDTGTRGTTRTQTAAVPVYAKQARPVEPARPVLEPTRTPISQTSQPTGLSPTTSLFFQTPEQIGQNIIARETAQKQTVPLDQRSLGVAQDETRPRYGEFKYEAKKTEPWITTYGLSEKYVTPAVQKLSAKSEKLESQGKPYQAFAVGAAQGGLGIVEEASQRPAQLAVGIVAFAPMLAYEVGKGAITGQRSTVLAGGAEALYRRPAQLTGKTGAELLAFMGLAKASPIKLSVEKFNLPEVIPEKPRVDVNTYRIKTEKIVGKPEPTIDTTYKTTIERFKEPKKEAVYKSSFEKIEKPGTPTRDINYKISLVKETRPKDSLYREPGFFSKTQTVKPKKIVEGEPAPTKDVTYARYLKATVGYGSRAKETILIGKETGGKVFRKVKPLNIPKEKIAEAPTIEGEQYIASKTQYKLYTETLKKGSGKTVVQQGGLLGVEGLEKGVELGRQLEYANPKVLEQTFTRETKSLNPRQVETSLGFVRKEGGKIKGSFANRAGRTPGDIDVLLQMPQAKAIPKIKRLATELNTLGQPTRVSKESPTLIEVQKGKEWIHAIDFKTLEDTTGIASTGRVYGLEQNQKYLMREGIKTQRRSEQLVRKVGASTMLQKQTPKLKRGLAELGLEPSTKNKRIFAPKDYRGKDIGDILPLSKPLAEAKGGKALEAYKAYEKLFPEKLRKEAQERYIIELDYTKPRKKTTPFKDLVDYKSFASPLGSAIRGGQRPFDIKLFDEQFRSNIRSPSKIRSRIISPYPISPKSPKSPSPFSPSPKSPISPSPFSPSPFSPKSPISPSPSPKSPSPYDYGYSTPSLGSTIPLGKLPPMFTPLFGEDSKVYGGRRLSKRKYSASLLGIAANIRVKNQLISKTGELTGLEVRGF